MYQDNPYIIGVPIDDPKSLFGRERLFDFVRDNLAQGAKVILLSGQRRMGKSSVLRHIPRLAALPGYVFVPFDLQASTRVPLGELLHRIGDEILRSLNLDSVKSALPSAAALNSDPATFVFSFLPKVYAALHDQKLVLLLDEFDALHDESDKEVSGRFFQYLQSVSYRDPNLFVITVVGRRLQQMPSLLTLFKDAPHQEIGLLPETSAKRQITRPAEGVLEYEPEAIKAVLALSARHPYFTQLLCHVLFQRARDEGEWTITPAIVESTVPDAITAGEGGLTWFREGLEIPERVVFSAVAELREVKTRRRIEAFLERKPSAKRAGNAVADLLESYGLLLNDSLLSVERRLLEWGFLREAGDDEAEGLNSGLVTVELVRRWLVQKHPLRQEIWELDRLSPRAQQLHEQGLEKRKEGDAQSAINLWNQAVEANPNHMHALGELAEAYLETRNYRQAASLYERVYLSDPARHKDGFLEAVTCEARGLINSNHYEEVREKLTLALTLLPGEAKLESLVAEAEEGIRRSFAVRNPFLVGDGIAPEKFVGRKSLVANALSTIASRGNIALSGETGMGKTSFLRYLSSEMVLRAHGLDPAQVIPVYVNCQSALPFSPTRFWQLVVAKLQELPDAPSVFLAPLLAKFFPNLLFASMQGRLSTGGKRVVLLLDDFDVALQPSEGYPEASVKELLQSLRSVAVSETHVVSFIVATHRRLSDIAPGSDSRASPLFNVLRFLQLPPFNETEVQELATQMPAAFAPLRETEWTWLYAVSNGYPYLVQAALALLFRRRADREEFEVKGATEELASEMESFLSGLWSRMSGSEQMLLRLDSLMKWSVRIRTSPSPLDFTMFPPLTRERQALQEKGLARIQATSGFEIAVPSLLEWWVLKKLESSEYDQFKQFVSSLNLSSEERERIGKYLNEVRQNSAALRSIEAWGRPLVPTVELNARS